MRNTIGEKKLIKSAVVIDVFFDEDAEAIGSVISKCDPDFREMIMNGNYPEDNFDNCECIPGEIGKYLFDVEFIGGTDFNGETTEYWLECSLLNCRKIEEIRYEKEINDLLRDTFYEDWMDEHDWREFLNSLEELTNFSVKLMSTALEEGIKNGYSIETQLELCRMVIQGLKESDKI
jgi:hypothetical protein